MDRRADLEASASQDVEPDLRDVFVRHYEPLLRLCVLLTGRLDVAEDLVQETFTRALTKAGRLPDEQRFAYLRTATWNVWKNSLRRLAMERRHRLTTLEVEQQAPYEERAVLWLAIQHLPVRQRSCVVLRYYEDLSEQQTATVLGCSVGTVKSQTSRALTRLRKELGDEDRG